MTEKTRTIQLMKKLIYISLFALSSFSLAETTFSPSSMLRQGCKDLDRRSCKSEITGHCEAVYLASPKASKDCKKISKENVKNICGHIKAKIFKSETECIGVLKDQKNCPTDLQSITQDSVKSLYSCPKLHKSLCKKICGARYDHVEVREFYQTGRQPGVICLDTSSDEVKAGENYSKDPVRTKCTEVHSGVSSWCIGFDYEIGSVKLGAFFKCGGKIRP